MSITDWSPWRKWWMDVVKWFLVTVVGFGLTFGVFNHFEQSRSEDRALCATYIEGVRRALVQFDGAASAYRASTYNAFNELYRWRSDQPTDAIRHWWTVAYPAIDAALRSLESAQPNVANETASFRDHMARGYKIIDNYFIDPRLDRIEAAYAGGIDPTEEQRRQALRPISREELERRKPELVGSIDEMERPKENWA